MSCASAFPRSKLFKLLVFLLFSLSKYEFSIEISLSKSTPGATETLILCHSRSKWCQQWTDVVQLFRSEVCAFSVRIFGELFCDETRVMFQTFAGICAMVAAFVLWSRHLCHDRGICAMVAAFVPWSRHLCHGHGICAMVAASFVP